MLKKKIYKLIKSCDFYGIDIGLNYRQHKNYRSFYGGLWSIVIATLISALCVSQFLDSILYLSPELEQIYTKSKQPDEKLLTSSFFNKIVAKADTQIITVVELQTTFDAHNLLSVEIPSVYEDVYDVDDPLKYGDSLRIERIISTEQSLIVDIQLEFLEYKTDSGLLWEMMSTQNSYNVVNVDTYYVKEVSPKVKINFSLPSPTVRQVKRSYKRIHRILSMVGGLVKVLMFIGKLFCKPITQLKFQISFLNQFFNFGTSKENQSFYPLNSQKLLRMQTVHFDTMRSKNNQQLNKQKTNVIKSILKKRAEEQNMDEAIIQDEHDDNLIEKYFQPQDIRLKLQHMQYVKYFFGFSGKLKKKIKSLRKSLQIVNQKTDIIYVFNKIQELEKLKQLLLNQDQLNLFEYIPKPNIDMFKINFPERKKNGLQKATEAFNSFQTINAKPVKSHIDIALMRMLDSNIKKYFVVSSKCISVANPYLSKEETERSENLKNEEVNEH